MLLITQAVPTNSFGFDSCSSAVAGLIPHKKRRHHQHNTDATDQISVVEKVGKSTQHHTAQQGDAMLLFPTIDNIPHTDGSE